MISDIHTYARKGLEAELARLDGEREKVQSLLASLGSATPAPAGRRPATRRPRQMSEAGRQAIREAVKRRWERVRAAAGAEGTNSADSTADSTPALASPKRGRRVNRTGNRKK